MTWQTFFDTYLNVAPGIGQIALRLGCAMLIGAVIGMEREYTHRPAGLRTHVLVALGACVVSITGEMLFSHYAALGATPDPARLSAQVITGVGFLGAGTIMKEGPSVKGLTTAASVWAVACLGIAAGFGHYAVALVGMVLILITLTLLEHLQQFFLKIRSSERSYQLDTEDISTTLNLLNSAAAENGATVFDLAVEQIDGGHRLTFRIWFGGRHSQKRTQQFFDTLACDRHTRHLSQTDTKTGAAV